MNLSFFDVIIYFLSIIFFCFSNMCIRFGFLFVDRGIILEVKVCDVFFLGIRLSVVFGVVWYFFLGFYFCICIVFGDYGKNS